MRTTEGTKRDAVQTGIAENACALTPMLAPLSLPHSYELQLIVANFPSENKKKKKKAACLTRTGLRLLRLKRCSLLKLLHI